MRRIRQVSSSNQILVSISSPRRLASPLPALLFSLFVHQVSASTPRMTKLELKLTHCLLRRPPDRTLRVKLYSGCPFDICNLFQRPERPHEVFTFRPKLVPR